MEGDENIETQQLTLDGETGRGWSDENRKNFLRQPILVLNSAEIAQIRLSRRMERSNRRMVRLNTAMLILNIFILILVLTVNYQKILEFLNKFI